MNLKIFKNNQFSNKLKELLKQKYLLQELKTTNDFIEYDLKNLKNLNTLKSFLRYHNLEILLI